VPARSEEVEMRLACFACLMAIGLAAPAHAATYTEASAPGAAFGARWDTPTEIGAGVEAVSGTGSQNVFDNFVFTALPGGAQTLTLRFSAPQGIDWSYSAGGAILYAARPFAYGWDGRYAGTVQIDYYQRERTVELALDDGFAGSLFLALNFTHGQGLGYSITAPSNAAPAMTPSPVPLPAGALLIGTALAALGTLRRRRRSAVAA
jgi:hypothetical protein